MDNYTLTILGCGTMGTAMLLSIMKATFQPYPAKFICCTGDKESAEALQKRFGDKIEASYGESNISAVKRADVIILGLKPYICESVLEYVKSGLNGHQVIISLLAGWSIERLSKYSSCIARVMTNTPAKFGHGMAIVSFSKEAQKYEDLVMNMIGTVGKALKLPEKHMDAATSLVGSGPAFCLLMLQAMAEGAVQMGIPYDIAKDCAAKVMEGTAKMVMETGEHPEALKAEVCTPGGTTIAGLLVMEDKGVRGGISRGVEKAAEVAALLGKK